MRHFAGGLFENLIHPSGEDPTLTQAIHDNRNEAEFGQWPAVHVFNARCNFSKQIVEHILSRGPMPGIKEKIVLVGHHFQWEALAKTQGFPIEFITRRKLKSMYNISAAPIMVVVDQLGTIRYAGSYFSQKDRSVFKDVAVIDSLIQQTPVEPMPLHGCAVVSMLSSTLGPWELRRWV